MRVRLESPKDSGNTSFHAPHVAGEDVLMEDDIVEEIRNMVDGATDGSEADNQSFLSSLRDFNITNSEELIKRLKGRDSNETEGGTKLDVARAALNDTVVPIAKKEVLLLDWLFDVLSKDAKDIEKRYTGTFTQGWSSPSNDQNYWLLLAHCYHKVALNDLVALANRFSIPSLLFAYSFAFKTFYFDFCTRSDEGPMYGSRIVKFFESLVKVRTSKQVMNIETLNLCLDRWMGMTTHWNGSNSESMEIQMATSQVEVFKVIMDLWCAEVRRGSNNRKASQFFCGRMLSTYSMLLFHLNRQSSYHRRSSTLDTHLTDLFQSLLYRIPYECLYNLEQVPTNQESLLEAIRQSESAFPLHMFSVYIAQFCLHKSEKRPSVITRKRDDTSYVEEKEWRQRVLESFISPAIEITLSTSKETGDKDIAGLQVHVESLKALLQTAQDCNLYFSDEKNMWEVVLAKIVKYVLNQHQKVAVDGTLEKVKGEAQIACMNVLSKVHEMDESVLTSELRKGATLCAFGHPASKDGLLDLLCNTSMKSREVVPFVNSALDTVEMAVGRALQQRDAVVGLQEQKSSKSVSQGLITSALLDRKFWQRTLGKAVRDFIGPGQSIELLSMMQDRLQQRFSEVYEVSTKKRKESGETSSQIFKRDQTYALAILDVYFASQLFLYLSIPNPVHEAAQEIMLILQKEGVDKCLAWALKQKNNEQGDSLASALLVLHEAIQCLCAQCGTGDHVKANDSWLDLASSWDKELDIHQHSFQEILANPEVRLAELRVQVHLSVIKRLERTLLRGESSPFGLLISEKGEENFGLLTEMEFKKYEEHGEEQSVRLVSAQWLHGLEREQLTFALWDIVLSQHLSIFDQLASTNLLSRMAKPALHLSQNISSLQFRLPTARESLVKNLKNLELKRWRDALCPAMKTEVEKEAKDGDQVMVKLASFVMITQFPIEWYPQQYLAEMWTLMFSHVQNTSWIFEYFDNGDLSNGIANQEKLPQPNSSVNGYIILLYKFLKDCLEERKESLGSCLQLSNDDLLECLHERSLRQLNGRRKVFPLFFRSCILYAFAKQKGSDLSIKVDQLCDFFTSMKWQLWRRLRTPNRRHDKDGHEDTPQSIMVVEAATLVVEQLIDALQRTSPEHKDLKSKVKASIKEKVTENAQHLQSIQPSSSLSWTKSTDFEHIASLLGLHSACLRLLYDDDKANESNDEEERQSGYKSMLDSAMELFNKRAAMQGPKIREKVSLQIMSCLAQASEIGWDVSDLEISNDQPIFNKAMFDFVKPEEAFGSWLSVLALIFNILRYEIELKCDSMTPVLITSEFDYKMSAILASACRHGSSLQFELTLSILLEALSKSGTETINDKVGSDAIEMDSRDGYSSDTFSAISEKDPSFPTLYNFCRFAHHRSRTLLQTTSILLCNGPEGTLITSQRSLTQLLTSITLLIKAEEVENSLDQPTYFQGYHTTLASIQVIETLINAKPILFRSGDMSTFLALASNILASQCLPGIDSPRKQTRKFFNHVVTCLIECIRLRRDAISPYLPQLSLLLIQLLALFQVSVVDDDSGLKDDLVRLESSEDGVSELPLLVWGKKSERTTLGINEARQMTRLLTVLTSKSSSSAPLIGGSSSRSKTKSLAGPFSTHAPYVIVAFIRNLTNSTSTNTSGSATKTTTTYVKGEAREELTRAIYTLCDIVGSWQKNVMMDLLADEGERIVFRTLWRRWESQRYKGA